MREGSRLEITQSEIHLCLLSEDITGLIFIEIWPVFLFVVTRWRENKTPTIEKKEGGLGDSSPRVLTFKHKHSCCDQTSHVVYFYHDPIVAQCPNPQIQGVDWDAAIDLLLALKCGKAERPKPAGKSC
ncbi:MAG: hypothetical protein HQM01_13745 [Magnetococcales bacterium]|nr:hypothetical protein [Magnetococcales bacterium]